MSHGRYEFAQRVGIKAHILASLAELGDLVSIPNLRKAIPAISQNAFEKSLLELERSGAISLRIAQSPMSLADGGKGGIYKENRGLLYYVVGG